jgi:hypothetical protein
MMMMNEYSVMKTDWKGSKLELSQETLQLEGEVTLPHVSSRAYDPGGKHLVRVPSQGYVVGRYYLLAIRDNLSERRRPRIKIHGPPR